MTNTKDSFRTQLEEAAGRAAFTHNWSGRTKVSNFKGDGWRLALTWDDEEQPASLTVYHRDNAGKRELQVAEAILAEQHDGGPAWLFDMVKRFLGYNTYTARLELIQDAAVPADPEPTAAMVPNDQPHPDRGNALELLEQVSAEMVAEDEQRHILAVAEQAGWMVHDYPVGSDWDRDYLAKMNLGLKGFFDKVYRFTAPDTADLVSVFFKRHQVYGAHLDSPGRQAFRSRGDNRHPWITNTVARWLVNPTDTLADGTDMHAMTGAMLTPPSPFVRMSAEQADKIPAGMPLVDALQAVQAENDSWAILRADVNKTSEALGVPKLATPTGEDRFAQMDQELADNVRTLVAASSEGLPQRKPGEFWPTVEPEDSDADKAEHRARHLAADMFTSYWDARDADMFDADDVTHLLELLDIARKAGR